MKFPVTIGAYIVAIAASLSFAPPALAQNVQGETDPIPRLSAEFWQLVVSIPPADNPLLDPTGALCMTGNRGSTWFLFGSFNGGSTTRTCSIPQGKSLFIPVLNQFEFNSPGVCGSPAVGVKQIRADNKAVIDAGTNIHVTLDGASLDSKIVRRISPVVEVTLPADNIFNGPGCVVPSQVYSPMAADGLYVLLRPLSLGSHTLNFTAVLGQEAFDTTYKLSIVPVVSR
jgi:hypothetical protein